MVKNKLKIFESVIYISNNIEIKKKITQKLFDIMGKEMTRVTDYRDKENTKAIDVLTFEDTLARGLKSCATIGLAETSIGLNLKGKELRTELIASSLTEDEKIFEKIMSTVAFQIIDKSACKPGDVFQNLIELYDDKLEVKHIMCCIPFLWKHCSNLELDEIIVTWLMLIPISPKEFEFAQEKGLDSLINLFKEKNIAIYDLNRKSAL